MAKKINLSPFNKKKGVVAGAGIAVGVPLLIIGAMGINSLIGPTDKRPNYESTKDHHLRVEETINSGRGSSSSTEYETESEFNSDTHNLYEEEAIDTSDYGTDVNNSSTNNEDKRNETTEITDNTEDIVQDESSADIIVEEPSINQTSSQVKLEMLLAKLTRLSRDCMQKATGSSTEPNITIDSFPFVTPNPNDSTVCIEGGVYVGSKYYSYSAICDTIDANYDIYDYGYEDISDEEVFDAMLDLLEECDYTFTLRQNIKIQDCTAVVSNILQKRLEDLESVKSNNTIDSEKTLLSTVNPNSVKLYTALNKSMTTPDGKNICSVKTVINLGKYSYISDHNIEFNDEIKTSQLSSAIEEYLLGDLENSTTYFQQNSAINNAINRINMLAEEELNADTSMSK